jgi:hypothetical protein
MALVKIIFVVVREIWFSCQDIYVFVELTYKKGRRSMSRKSKKKGKKMEAWSNNTHYWTCSLQSTVNDTGRSMVEADKLT